MREGKNFSIIVDLRDTFYNLELSKAHSVDKIRLEYVFSWWLNQGFSRTSNLDAFQTVIGYRQKDEI